MDTYIEINFRILSQAENDRLIAILTDIGFEAFEEQDKVLKAYIPEREFDKMLINEIAAENNLSYAQSSVEQKNWNEIWEQSFEPVIIEGFCAIRASFHAPISDVKYEIVITPKMSFGTGHHATTYMMMESLRNIGIKGKSVFDFGTGSGVLSILAEKMGALSVDAIDIDDWSINNAKENIEVNHCENIHLYKSASLPSHKNYDIVFANINKNVILEQLPQICGALSRDGIILLSGILVEDGNELRNALTESGLVVSNIREKQNWLCIQCNARQD